MKGESIIFFFLNNKKGLSRCLFFIYFQCYLYVAHQDPPSFRGGSKLQPIPGVFLFATDAYKKEEEA